MFWSAAGDPAVLPVHAIAAPRGGPDTLDLFSLPLAITVFRESPLCEHAVIADGPRHIRLEASGDSLIAGPVRLRYDLDDFLRLRTRLLTLSRLESAVRSGRLPTRLYEPDPLAVRWMTALAAWDMKGCGASQIDIAIALFGADQVDGDTIDRMRKRVARLLVLARRRIDPAYRRMLAGNPEQPHGGIDIQDFQAG